ncbi:uncharacterized protein RJT21DRAFT_37825 [Scheffersomyces amazonensis]|uniref:uncharacterized protein n=1 Tax=Scheffersomyces amazonensis TaxID=1078765 RepID=UPI00315D1010
MAEDIIRTRLQEYLELIELSHWDACINSTSAAKKKCLQAVKILNEISKLEQVDAQTRTYIIQLSKFSLALYDKLNDKAASFSYSEKLEWMGSKLSSELFSYPIINFGNDLTSSNSIFIPSTPFNDTTPQIHQLPLNTEFEKVDVCDWSADLNDLSTLYQDLLDNCSFVSSLLSIVSIPCSLDKLIQIISPRQKNEKFKVSLAFNGSLRLVTVDNKLPKAYMNRNLIVTSSDNTDLLWPALIEKAYLKVMGDGYKFSGSNMAIDTFMLTRWIPEIMPIRHGILPMDLKELWKFRIENKVLLGVGTGNLSKKLSSQLKLIPGHDYVVHSIDEDGSIVVKNPWIENNDEDKRFLKISDLNHFSYLYCNWKIDDKLPLNEKVHFIYNNTSPFLFSKPQFSFYNSSDQVQESWIFLERHLPITKEVNLLNVSVYETVNGNKVLYPNQYKCVNPSNTETNNRMKLVKLKLAPKTYYTVVITSSKNSTFTISLLNNYKALKLTKAKYLYQSLLPLIDGEWNSTNSGGNWSLSSYITNPQYSIEVLNPTDMIISIFSNIKDDAINFHLFHAEKQFQTLPLRCFDKSKLLFNEHYSEGYQAYIFKNLRPGFYKLVVSTYDFGTLGDFKILLNHNDANLENVKVEKIFPALNLFNEKRKISWEGSNRFKVRFQLSSFKSNVTIHLKHLHDEVSQYDSIQTYRPAIRGSIFDAHNSQPIQINEQWSDSLYGVYIDCMIERPGEYILLVERFEVGQGLCIVEIGSDKKVSIV